MRQTSAISTDRNKNGHHNKSNRHSGRQQYAKRAEGWYLVTMEEWETVQTEIPGGWAGPTKTYLAGTYIVHVSSQEMGRLHNGQEVSIVRGGIFSSKYYLKGNSNCSLWCNSIVVKVKK